MKQEGETASSFLKDEYISRGMARLSLSPLLFSCHNGCFKVSADALDGGVELLPGNRFFHVQHADDVVLCS